MKLMGNLSVRAVLARLGFTTKQLGSFVAILPVLAILTSTANAGFWEPFTISSSPNQKSAPAIHGNIVAWAELRSGEFDIIGYDLTTNTEFVITEHVGNQFTPQIYEDIVVWTDFRNGNADIYGYNLSTATEFQITSDPNDQRAPEIWGDTVVWEDFRNDTQNFNIADIFGYTLSTQAEFALSTDPGSQFGPAIHNDTVVWGSDQNGGGVYSYDLTTNTEFLIEGEPPGGTAPDVFGDTVVWNDVRNFKTGTYWYDLTTGTEHLISEDNDSFVRHSAAIFGNLVLWFDGRDFVGGNDTSIYGYDLSINSEFQVATDIGGSSSFDLHNNTVVWMDRNSASGPTEFNILGAQYVPEPGTLALVGLGSIALVRRIRRRTMS